ncbi:MAG: hypothetical protein ACI9JM_001594 [Halioglobus sp.]|jgi:hypothetical protein
MSYKSAVLKQAVLGIFLIPLLGTLLWFSLPDPVTPNRAVYTLSWAALFSVPLFLGIHSALFQRFGSEELIKGHASASQLGFHSAYLSNTLEQTLVNVLTAISLGMVAPMEYIKLVPIQACLYVVGRIMFFFTYKNNPMSRFAGFAVGYYVAAISLVLTLCWSF